MVSSSEQTTLLPHGGGGYDEEDVPVLESMELGSGGYYAGAAGVDSKGIARGKGEGGVHGGPHPSKTSPSNRTSACSRAALISASLVFALTLGVMLGVFGVSAWERANLSLGAEHITRISAAGLPESVASRPYIHVGFQCGGDFGWLALTKLLELALPGVDIRFSDPDLVRTQTRNPKPETLNP